MRTLVFVLLLFVPAAAAASGHGPVFAYATPTNSEGEWSYDLTLAGRDSAAGEQLTSRAIVGYGFTSRVMASISVTALLANTTLPPTRLQAGDEFEANLAWRFTS